MKLSIIKKHFLCPKCKSALKIVANKNNNEIRVINNGQIICNNCSNKYQIKNYIPRFVSESNYADNFGFQWNLYNQTQLDSRNKLNISENRFNSVTKWQKDLSGQNILEAGCGMGRFTEIAIKTNATIFSFDYSNSVAANYDNNGNCSNLYLFQADIFSIPLKNNFFDKIFCFGVLQHTPNPKKAFLNLIPLLKNNGEICIDIYDFSFRTALNLKYWLRPITKRLNPQTLYRLIKFIVPIVFPIKMFIMEKIPFGKYFAFFIPIAYHKGFISEMDELPYNKLLEWSILDTFDKFSPQYDKPRTKTAVKRWFKEVGLKNIIVSNGPNGIIAKGKKSIIE